MKVLLIVITQNENTREMNPGQEILPSSLFLHENSHI